MISSLRIGSLIRTDVLQFHNDYELYKAQRSRYDDRYHSQTETGLTVSIAQPVQKCASSAWDILVACCSGNTARAVALDSALTDPDELLRLALWHGVAPLLATSSDRLPFLLDPRTRDRLGQIHSQSLRHNLRLCMCLLQVLRALQENGVSAIPFKGPILAANLYGDMALRQCADLDVLVRPADAPAALSTLQQLGFRPEYVISPKRIAALLANDFEIALVRDGIYLELHWDVLPPFYGINFNLDAAWKRSRLAGVLDAKVPELSPEDLFLALTLHASKHFWAKLIWLCDLARLIENNEQFDWDFVLERARSMRVERLLLIALTLLREVFAVAPSSTSAATTTLERRLGNTDWRRPYRIAKDNLCSANPEIGSIRRYCFFLSARDARSDALRQLLRHSLTPGPDEWSASAHHLPLPFYLPKHLWRLTVKLLRLRLESEVKTERSNPQMYSE